MERKAERAPVQAEPARFPAWLAWAAVLGWGGFVLFSHYSSLLPESSLLARALSPFQYFPVSFKASAAAASSLLAGCVFAAAAVMAGGLLSRLFYRGSTRLERLIFSFGAGLAVFSLAFTVLGFTGLLYKWAVMACGAGLAGFGLFVHLERARRGFAGADGTGTPCRMVSPADAAGESLSAADMLLLLLLAGVLLVNLTAALGPEIFYDALVYHLAAPNAYNLAGGIEHIPYNLYSNLPMAHGLLYSAALFFNGDTCAKLLNFSAGLFSALAAFALGRRLYGRRAGLWAAALFYAVTHVMVASWSAGTDTLLTLFSTLALYSALRAEGEGRYGWLALAGLMAGMAMGTKYTGLFPALGAGAAYLAKERRLDRAMLKELAFTGLIAALVVAPWLARNWAYKGNPVYPFMTTVFGADPLSSPEKIKGFLGETRQMGGFEPGRWLMHPWATTMGKVANSEFFSPLFLALLPVCFLLAAPSSAAPPLWAYFLTVWLTWSFSSSMVRFLMPALPAAGVLLAGALAGRERTGLKAGVRWAMLASFCVSAAWGLIIFNSQGRHLVPTGAESREEFLPKTRPGHAYSSWRAYDYINRNLPADARVLVIGDARTFYLQRQYLASSVFDLNPVVELSAASRSGRELYELMAGAGITHLVLNVAEAIRLGRGYRTFYWDAAARRNFYDFWDRHAVELQGWTETEAGRFVNRVAVYEIAAEKPGRQPAFNLVRDVVMRGIEGER
ncbi:MAG: glycosyl transferase family protein [Elusimicrobia bacterium]|nr:MAG: glycosyl transferase family protein [Elusimicrobiota bacterium]